jgi:hypothetical protein
VDLFILSCDDYQSFRLIFQDYSAL